MLSGSAQAEEAAARLADRLRFDEGADAQVVPRVCTVVRHGVRFWNMAPTDVPVWMRWIASPSSGATETILMLSVILLGGIGIELVQTYSRIGLPFSRPGAPPESTACVEDA